MGKKDDMEQVIREEEERVRLKVEDFTFDFSNIGKGLPKRLEEMIAMAEAKYGKLVPLKK